MLINIRYCSVKRRTAREWYNVVKMYLSVNLKYKFSVSQLTIRVQIQAKRDETLNSNNLLLGRVVVRFRLGGRLF